MTGVACVHVLLGNWRYASMSVGRVSVLWAAYALWGVWVLCVCVFVLCVYAAAALCVCVCVLSPRDPHPSPGLPSKGPRSLSSAALSRGCRASARPPPPKATN